MENQKRFDTPLYPYQRSSDQDQKKPARHPVVIIGAGPVGLAAAIDLAQNDIPVVVIDDNDRVSTGSRAICFSKRSLEILDRLGCGEEFLNKGVTWSTGKVFFDTREIYHFDLLAEKGHKRPAFINLQQYYLEDYLVQRFRELEAQGKPLELRGKNKMSALTRHEDYTTITIDTPDGEYQLEADWLIACDGANSTTRNLMDLDFVGRIFEDNFLIADVVMEADFPTQRWFWFDPPFNRGQSALLHKQPDNVWRIDFQLGWDIDRNKELQRENVISRLKAMLGKKIKFELEWVSLYTFQSRRMEKFRHGRILFCGDSAHQVSPFGARGANSGLQDIDNLCWKLKLIIEQKAPSNLMDTYDRERVYGAEENILNSTRSTDFITPKSEISLIFRNAVLELAEITEFARHLVNSGRLSVPCTYDRSMLNGPDMPNMPAGTRPGSALVDADVNGNWLNDMTGNCFQILAINMKIPDGLAFKALEIEIIDLPSCADLKNRYLGGAASAIYLIRPDQHVMARWDHFDMSAIRKAMNNVTGTPVENLHE